MGFFDGINQSVNNSRVGKFFQMEERGTNLLTEFRGAIATFMTMAYILAVLRTVVVLASLMRRASLRQRTRLVWRT